MLAGCGTAGQSDQTPAFAEIGPAERITVVGTEPFWNAVIEGDRLTYSTPDNAQGSAVQVMRFAGNIGLGFNGTLQDEPIDLLITKEPCSDGMSERMYPFTATLQLGTEQRTGCAWTARQPFRGPAAP